MFRFSYLLILDQHLLLFILIILSLQVKDQFVFGCAFALESIPFSVISADDAFDLDIIKGDDAVNIADVWTLSNIKDKSARRRLADVIVHAVDEGYL